MSELQKHQGLYPTLEEQFVELRSELAAERQARQRAEAGELMFRMVLKQIQGWDCLNPPQPELCADLPWLKKLVDAALSGTAGRSLAALVERLRAAKCKRSPKECSDFNIPLDERCWPCQSRALRGDRE